ncbi:PLP-dependent aminotransferase family protein [Bdellovibrio sp. NC01]|uniref:MocR-like pyridoxine biosynthesis transcription factor PdxR n=1 Tax=Bdellovibrio sp. NC01 TaxID=2220073 RepID=UPI00115B218C|nr:PLP-dependent aminotransferase family protein [Bdellovibrio sp. NC01]QDK37173.1 PLP-dependent aminotransferase family protein [Bdellovibrio sp. NC01]
MASATKYQRIYDRFLNEIKEGVLKSGERIPSTRDLAKTHRCHRLTVMNALQSLVAEGWLEAREKSHYFVSEKTPITNSLKQAKLTAKVPKFRLSKPGFSLREEKAKHRIEFWGGQPDLRLFPMNEFRLICADSLKRVKPELLNYGSFEGLEVFRAQVADYFRRSRSLTDKSYLITNGSQEGIYLIAQALLNPGDAIAVEAKGYAPVWGLFENLGLQIVPISVDEEGLNTEELEKAISAKKIKMVYVTPLHQYPTTVTLSPRRRQHLLQLAEKHQMPILEDDYDHECHYLSPPPAPLATQSSYAIYIASFSKILFPGSRLGVIACHESLLKPLAEQKYLVSRQTDAIAQLALAAWMKEGGFEKHVRRMTRAYEKRFFLMQEHLKQIKAEHDISWYQPNGGLCYWVNLHTNSRLVAEDASQKGYFFQNEKSSDFNKKDGTHLRIGFACVNDDEIAEGMQALGQILKKRKTKTSNLK